MARGGGAALSRHAGRTCYPSDHSNTTIDGAGGHGLTTPYVMVQPWLVAFVWIVGSMVPIVPTYAETWDDDGNSARLMDRPWITVENRTGQNLPELDQWVAAPLLDVVAATSMRPERLRLVIRRVSVTNGRELHARAFPVGIRSVCVPGFVNDWVTVWTEGEVWLLDPSGAIVLERKTFSGRAAAWLDYESWLATNRARREHAGFLLDGGRENPLGPLLAQSLANGFSDERVEAWLTGLSGRSANLSGRSANQ